MGLVYYYVMIYYFEHSKLYIISQFIVFYAYGRERFFECNFDTLPEVPCNAKTIITVGWGLKK